LSMVPSVRLFSCHECWSGYILNVVSYATPAVCALCSFSCKWGFYLLLLFLMPLQLQVLFLKLKVFPYVNSVQLPWMFIELSVQFFCEQMLVCFGLQCCLDHLSWHLWMLLWLSILCTDSMPTA
jgi:hypothetical protein